MSQLTDLVFSAKQLSNHFWENLNVLCLPNGSFALRLKIDRYGKKKNVFNKTSFA